MNKVLTTPETHAAPAWDSRPFSLTLAGCLAVAGMPLPPKEESSTFSTNEPAASFSPTGEAFHIDSAESANWYLRKLAALAAEKQRITAQTEKMLTELDTDAAGLKFLYESDLQEWVRKELDRKGGRKKTLHLLQGTAAFRTVPASVKVSDPLAALTYAKENGLPCIVSSERLDAEEYKKLAEGKLLPGMDTTPERESFTVTFGTP